MDDGTISEHGADDVLVMSSAASILGAIVAERLAQRFPGLEDVEGWARDATQEIFAACQDVTAAAVFAVTGVMP